MESSSDANEATPLLADPPIDDDIYHYEQRIFPSPLQKQLLLGKFSISFFVSRWFEIATAVWVCRLFGTSFLPVTIYTIAVNLISSPLWFVISKILAQKSRKVTIAYAIVAERISAILFCSLLLTDVQKHYWLSFSAGVLLVLIERACDLIQVHVIETDWAQVLANNESVPYAALTELFRSIKTVSCVATPILGTLVVQWLEVEHSIRVLRMLASLSMIVEYSLVRKLYSTCYALRVPNLVTRTSGKFMFTRPSLERVCFYVKKRPRPVLIAIGLILTQTTLLIVRSQQLYYMDRYGVSLVFIGAMASLSFITIPFPYWAAVLLNISTSLLAVWSLLIPNPWLFGVSCALNRISLHPIEGKAQAYIRALIPDPQSQALFDMIRTRLAKFWTLAIFLLPAFWLTLERFIWPIALSVLLSFAGLFAVEWGFRWGETPIFLNEI